jgi:hypothetical protein
MHRDTIRRLIESGVFDEPRPGVLVMSSTSDTWQRRLAVAQAASADHAVASHRAAARLHGLDGFIESSVLELTTTRRMRSAPDVVVHQVEAIDPSDRVVIDGLRTTGLARTLVDLGAVVEPSKVERALDDARRRGVSLKWVETTALRLQRRGRAGPPTVLQLLDGIDTNQQVRGSWFEAVVERLLDDPRIPPLVRQYVIRDENGLFVARADLAVPSLRHAIEAHSRRFHFGRVAECRDQDRDLRLSEIGWDTTYLGHQSTRHPREVVELVVRILDQRRGLIEH